MAIVRVGTDHTVVSVVVEQSQGDLVKRGVDCGQLGQDVDAVAIVLDHALDAADLSLDPAQALEELVLARRVAARGHGAFVSVHGSTMHTGWGYANVLDMELRETRT